jgi:hypothetical protein
VCSTKKKRKEMKQRRGNTSQHPPLLQTWKEQKDKEKGKGEKKREKKRKGKNINDEVG